MISRRSPSPPKPSVVTRGLIEHFDFADGKGTETTLKSRVSDNVLTLSNFNFDENSGWTGKGLKFDGVDDSVAAPTNLLSDFTVEVFADLQNRSSNGNLIRMQPTDSGVWQTTGEIEVWNRTLPNVWVTILKQQFSTTASTHFVLSQDYGSNVSTASLNGQLETKNHELKVSTKKSIGIDIGTVGVIHSIKTYNVALTPEEIAQNYEYEQNIDRTTISTYPMLQEELSYGIGLANQLSEEQKSTFRLSIDGNKFVAGLRYCEGLEVEEFTYSEIQVEMEKEEWSKIEELE